MTPANFTLTAGGTGASYAPETVLYFPNENMVSLLFSEEKLRPDRYTLSGSGVKYGDGTGGDFLYEDCCVTAEKKGEPDTVSVLGVSYTQKGVPVYDLKGKTDITIHIKISNSTKTTAEGLRFAVAFGEGQQIETASADISAQSVQVISVDLGAHQFSGNEELKITRV